MTTMQIILVVVFFVSTIVGYLLINNEYIYTNYETHSVQSLANAYLTELASNQVIIDNRGLLTYLSQMSSKTSE